MIVQADCIGYFGPMLKQPRHHFLICLLVWGIIVIQYPTLLLPLLDTHHIRQVDTASIIRNMQRYRVDVLSPFIDWVGPTHYSVEMDCPLYNALMAWMLNVVPIDSEVGLFREENSNTQGRSQTQLTTLWDVCK